MLTSLKLQTSLKLKLVLSLGAILGAVFFVTGYMTYTWHVQIAKEEISSQFSRTVDQVMYSVDQKVQSSYKLSNQMLFHPVIIDVLRKRTATYFDTLTVQDILDQMMLSESQLLSINLFDLDGNQYRPANSFLFRPLKASAYNSMVDKLAGTDGELIWFRSAVDELLDNSTLDGDVIVAARWMKTDKLETYGLLVFVFHKRYFMNELQHVMQHADGQLQLYNSSGELLYADEPTAFEAMGSMETAEDDSYIYAESVSERTDFRLASRTSLAELEDKSGIILKISLYSGLVSIALSSILLMLAMQRLFTPMTKLVEGMRKVRAGQMDTQIEVRTRDEMAFLGESFNSMIRNINQLIEEVYEKQLREREAELKAIQAQLNPHFLYNTLDMVYWRLYLQNDHDNAKLIVALSEMLRYSLEPAGGETTLKDELRQLHNYLSIQHSRFGDSLQVTVEADEDAMDAIIVPLLLQPIVENVFVHAFQHKSVPMQLVTVRVFRIDNDLIAEITDNGGGIPSSTIAELLEGSSSGQGRERHIGLRSVIRRIELLYGDPYRLEIESTPGEGTLVRLNLPYRRDNSGMEGEGTA